MKNLNTGWAAGAGLILGTHPSASSKNPPASRGFTVADPAKGPDRNRGPNQTMVGRQGQIQNAHHANVSA